MKLITKSFGWRLIAIATLLVFALTACQSAAEKSAQSTQTAVAAVEATAVAALPTSAPTAAPIVLEGAITTGSGLQYLELAAGDGVAPAEGNIISMHFVVLLPDGTEVFNSRTEGSPASAIFGRNQLLPGWEEGVGLMKAGGSARLVLPPELAFGAEGSGIIPPDSQLIMDIDLLSVKPAPTPSSVSSSQLQTTASGLQYYDLVLGDGAEAISGTLVSNGYSLWVLGENEHQFIVSSDDTEPINFRVGQGSVVFPGWEEGVVGMKVGGKRYLIVPPALGMGDMGSGDIPANAVLIMEIELLKVTEPLKATVVDEKDYVTTPSGLKYYDLQVGDGATPTAGQTVVVHYTGWLTDGTQFDSSVESGAPFSFTLGVGGVIPGWDEGVATMKVGSKRQLVIPAALAYGDTGSGSIPPGATLIFEVELLEIQP